MDSFDTRLSDGRVVSIRDSSVDDEVEFVQAFERLSADARYMRFMRVARQVDMNRLRKVLASFPQDGIGLVATVPAADGIDIVGSAVAVFAKERSSCEFAITVAAECRGVGLAPLLMTTLIAAAARRGLEEMEGFVLAANRPMLRLAARLGFTVETDPDDPTVRVCRLAL
jgi:RimJ/RimL family protein N-acetyltransferase